MINIAVIGRQLGSDKWSTLFDLLKQGQEADYWTYSAFDVDKLDRGHFKTQTFDYHILVGTKPVDETPNIRFYSTATEEDIIGKMQTLADSIYEEENGNSTDNSPTADVREDNSEPGQDSDVDSNNLSTAALLDNSLADCYYRTGCVDDERDGYDHLVGIQVEIEGETVFLDYESAKQLKEMLEVMDKYGYHVKRVITGNTSGDD